MSNYVTKSDLKNITVVKASKFAKAVDLTGLKSEVDKVDIDELNVDKLKTVTVGLKKLSHAVDNDLIKKTI